MRARVRRDFEAADKHNTRRLPGPNERTPKTTHALAVKHKSVRVCYWSRATRGGHRSGVCAVPQNNQKRYDPDLNQGPTELQSVALPLSYRTLWIGLRGALMALRRGSLPTCPGAAAPR